MMAEKFWGRDDQRTQTCLDLLNRGFACHYDPDQSCGGAPKAFYDQAWGGAVSQEGYNNDRCGGADFGNACYNDHHYHYGYFVTPAAILLQLRPEMANNAHFVDYINTLVRDVVNPSADDGFFPQFRSFDWFDLHSWSHGVIPGGDGKDEESTTEEANMFYGVQQWGRVLGNREMEQVGATMLGVLSHTVREVFFMRRDNKVHHPDYVKNRITGIHFQSKVQYATFFGGEQWFIHGIQMLPLSPALLMLRDPEFCEQEWDDVLSHMDLTTVSPGWLSLLVTGNVAIRDPDSGYEMVKALDSLDNGLGHAWAMYWAASLATSKSLATAQSQTGSWWR